MSSIHNIKISQLTTHPLVFEMCISKVSIAIIDTCLFPLQNRADIKR